MQPQPDQQPSEPPAWQYTPEAAEQASPTQTRGKTNSPESVSWTASEFIAHHKSMGWYVRLALVGILGATVIYLLTRDLISTGMILLVMVALGAFAGRQPRSLEYAVDRQGVHVGQKTYPYLDFKSFSVIDEEALSSISLLPLKRFMPPLSLYYDPKDEDRIINVLSAQLPFEERQKDAIDRLMHRIRF